MTLLDVILAFGGAAVLLSVCLGVSLAKIAANGDRDTKRAVEQHNFSRAMEYDHPVGQAPTPRRTS